jgi:hypothetical protein
LFDPAVSPSLLASTLSTAAFFLGGSEVSGIFLVWVDIVKSFPLLPFPILLGLTLSLASSLQDLWLPSPLYFIKSFYCGGKSAIVSNVDGHLTPAQQQAMAWHGMAEKLQPGQNHVNYIMMSCCWF